jgi:hypothetical protein
MRQAGVERACYSRFSPLGVCTGVCTNLSLFEALDVGSDEPVELQCKLD